MKLAQRYFWAALRRSWLQKNQLEAVDDDVAPSIDASHLVGIARAERGVQRYFWAQDCRQAGAEYVKPAKLQPLNQQAVWWRSRQCFTTPTLTQPDRQVQYN